MPGIKYTLMLLPVSPDSGNDGQTQLASDLITWRGRLSDLIEPQDVEHWREWLGTLEWEEFMSEHRLVLAYMNSEHPEAINGESQLLRNRVNTAWQAMLLAAPIHPFYGVARCIGGEARSISSQVRLLSIKEEGPLGTTECPLYNSRQAFVDVLPWQNHDPWFDRWRNWISLLDQIPPPGFPQILRVAFAAFKRALSPGDLESSIPDLVRAAECILAVPRNGGGAREFVRRAIQIAPGLASHWYVGMSGGPLFTDDLVPLPPHATAQWYADASDLEKWLFILYGHRSACVHGKIPFLELQQNDAGTDEVARFDYLAEALAREAISIVLRNPAKFIEFKDRATLEDAWATGRFP